MRLTTQVGPVATIDADSSSVKQAPISRHILHHFSFRLSNPDISMKLLNLTLANAAGNIAMDEALLNVAESAAKSTTESFAESPVESGQPAAGYLRLWTPRQNIVVLGRSCKAADEVHLDFCRKHSIPVIRRSSGGGTILTGPGCLMYAVVVPYGNQNELRMIDRAHAFVLDRVMQALRSIEVDAASRGQSDLAIDRLKFSGNAMRCKRHHFLYHGTLLLDFDLALIERALKTPPRQPDYREGRSHREFVTNLAVSETDLRKALVDEWQATPDENWPNEATENLITELIATKYSRDDWNFRM